MIHNKKGNPVAVFLMWNSKPFGFSTINADYSFNNIKTIKE
jgi:hypothetical protein